MSIHPEFSSGGERTGHVAFAWGTYPEGSVLHGREMRVWLGLYPSVGHALADWPDADASEWTSHRPSNHMPMNPPDWYDPMDAGEAWGEDDY